MLFLVYSVKSNGENNSLTTKMRHVRVRVVACSLPIPTIMTTKQIQRVAGSYPCLLSFQLFLETQHSPVVPYCLKEKRKKRNEWIGTQIHAFDVRPRVWCLTMRSIGVRPRIWCSTTRLAFDHAFGVLPRVWRSSWPRVWCSTMLLCLTCAFYAWMPFQVLIQLQKSERKYRFVG